jgi:hypothetical protein
MAHRKAPPPLITTTSKDRPMNFKRVILLLALGTPAISFASVGVCEQLQSTKAKIGSALASASASLPAVLKLAGVTALKHSSGAMIAAANGAYLPHMLGAAGAVVGALTSPPAIVAGSTVVLSVGGVYLACQIIGSSSAAAPGVPSAGPEATSWHRRF